VDGVSLERGEQQLLEAGDGVGSGRASTESTVASRAEGCRFANSILVRKSAARGMATTGSPFQFPPAIAWAGDGWAYVIGGSNRMYTRPSASRSTAKSILAASALPTPPGAFTGFRRIIPPLVVQPVGTGTTKAPSVGPS
jgi:hypothetical protein